MKCLTLLDRNLTTNLKMTFSHYPDNFLIKCSSWIKIWREGSSLKENLITCLRLANKFTNNLKIKKTNINKKLFRHCTHQALGTSGMLC
jgi:hypothetical protein